MTPLETPHPDPSTRLQAKVRAWFLRESSGRGRVEIHVREDGEILGLVARDGSTEGD